jgi:hypothetical protein
MQDFVSFASKVIECREFLRRGAHGFHGEIRASTGLAGGRD